MRNVKEFAGGVFVRMEIPSGTKKAIDDAKRDYHSAKGEKILQEELLRQALVVGIRQWRVEQGI